MNGMVAGQISNEKIKCKTGKEFWSSTKNKVIFKSCEFTQGASLRLHFKRKASYNTVGGDPICPCYDLIQFEKGLGDYTSAKVSKYLKILKKKYKLTVSPTDSQLEKSGLGFGDGNLSYIFTNTKDKTAPLYIELYTFGSVGGRWIKVRYMEENLGKEILGLISKQKKEDEDL